MVARLTESISTKQKTDGDAGDADQKQRSSAHAIDQKDGCQGKDDRCETQKNTRGKCGIGSYASLLEDGSGVKIDRVDTRGLLQNAQTQTHQKDVAQGRLKKLSDTHLCFLVFFADALVDGLHLDLGLLASVDAFQHLLRLDFHIVCIKPPRASRDEEQQDEVENGREEFHPKHPAPDRIIIQYAVWSAIELVEIVIAQKSGKEAQNDIQLLNGDEHASVLCRGDLRYVHGRQDQCGTKGQTADHSGDVQRFIGKRISRSKRRKGIKESHADQDLLSSDQIAQSSCNEHGDHRRKGGRTDHPAILCITEIEFRSRIGHNTRNDPCIKAEKEPPKRNHKSDKYGLSCHHLYLSTHISGGKKMRVGSIARPI